MERLKRPESRRMAQPWQVSKRLRGLRGLRGFRGLRGLRRLKGSFGPLEKKDLARQSPEPTACATPPTVSQSPEPTVWQVRGFGASEASRIQKLAACSNGQYGPQSGTEPRAHSLAWLLQRPVWPTVWHRAQSPQSSKCEVLERLKRPWSV